MTERVWYPALVRALTPGLEFYGLGEQGWGFQWHEVVILGHTALIEVLQAEFANLHLELYDLRDTADHLGLPALWVLACPPRCGGEQYLMGPVRPWGLTDAEFEVLQLMMSEGVGATAALAACRDTRPLT